LAKIAVNFESARPHFERADAPSLLRRPLVRGDGWTVCDVICNAGPRVRPTEEQHSKACIAIVRAGSFQYQSSAGRELMTPGSLLLGNTGQYFECGHEHGVGDRCLSFTYDAQFVDGLVADAGMRTRTVHFSSLRVPPVRALSNVVARACAGLSQSNALSSNPEQARFWEEIAIELAIQALEFGNGTSNGRSSPAAEARVTRIIRMIESRPAAKHDLASLARDARLSRYHFLRIFQQLTGLTPHQYVLRRRLRHAATQLLQEPGRILDIVLNSGFGDVSNFNHAFRTEFGVSPRLYRIRASMKLQGGTF
jgi:AraC-like DNA-binding protein